MTAMLLACVAIGLAPFVEACRAIGERLVESWARWPETRPTKDEELHARRLVALPLKAMR
jgi:hypothetical protein